MNFLTMIIGLSFLMSCIKDDRGRETANYNQEYRISVYKEGLGKIENEKFLFSREEEGQQILFKYKSLSNYPSFNIILHQDDDTVSAKLIENNDTISLTGSKQITVLLSLNKGYKIYSFLKNTPSVMDDNESFFISPDYGVLIRRMYYPMSMQTLIKSSTVGTDTLNYLIDAIFIRPKFWETEK